MKQIPKSGDDATMRAENRRYLHAGAALVLSLLFFVHSAPAQELSEDEVLARSLDAVGGARAWKAIETMEWSGDFSTFSTTHPFTIQRQRPKLYRFDYREADRDVTVVYDGERTWWRNDWVPFAGVPWPTAPSRIYARGFEADAEFVYPYLEPGNEVELVGKTDWDGSDAWELAVTLGNGLVETWYLDPETFLPMVRITRAGYVIGLDKEHRMFFSDFRAVAGVQIPHYIETELGNRFGVMKVDSVVVNEPIPPQRFVKPVPPPVQRLGFLAGKWKVAGQSRQVPTQPFLFQDEGVSVITPKLDGQVFEETLFYHDNDRPRNVTRTFTFDRFKGEYRVLHLDDLTYHPILLRGAADAENLSFDNLETGTEWGFPGMPFHNRLVMQGPTDKGFTLEWQTSSDGGQMWATMARFEYSRFE